MAIAELSQMLKDHIARYERDTELARAKDQVDYEHTQRWRNQMDQTQREQTEKLAIILPVHLEMVQKIKDNSEILGEIAPNYRRGMWVVGAIIVGSVGYLVKAFWSHVKLAF